MRVSCKCPYVIVKWKNLQKVFFAETRFPLLFKLFLKLYFYKKTFIVIDNGDIFIDIPQNDKDTGYLLSLRVNKLFEEWYLKQCEKKEKRKNYEFAERDD